MLLNLMSRHEMALLGLIASKKIVEISMRFYDDKQYH